MTVHLIAINACMKDLYGSKGCRSPERWHVARAAAWITCFTPCPLAKR
jgi:hypothetical protein